MISNTTFHRVSLFVHCYPKSTINTVYTCPFHWPQAPNNSAFISTIHTCIYPETVPKNLKDDIFHLLAHQKFPSPDPPWFQKMIRGESSNFFFSIFSSNNSLGLALLLFLVFGLGNDELSRALEGVRVGRRPQRPGLVARVPTAVVGPHNQHQPTTRETRTGIKLCGELWQASWTYSPPLTLRYLHSPIEFDV